MLSSVQKMVPGFQNRVAEIGKATIMIHILEVNMRRSGIAYDLIGQMVQEKTKNFCYSESSTKIGCHHRSMPTWIGTLNVGKAEETVSNGFVVQK